MLSSPFIKRVQNMLKKLQSQQISRLKTELELLIIWKQCITFLCNLGEEIYYFYILM